MTENKSSSYTPGLRVSSGTSVKKIRELPVPGILLVGKGQSVSAEDIVAKAELPGELHVLRLPERMGLETFEVINGLQVKEGDVVSEGQVLCQHAGLFGLLKTTYRAPESGTIEFITERTGHLGLRMQSKEIEIDAFIGGRVIEVDTAKSVTIESYGAFVQGIFGVGGEAKGQLKLLAVNRESQVEEADIPEDIAGQILVGGSGISIAALNKASSLAAVGVIAGAIDDKVLAAYLGYDLGIALTGDEEVPMTLIVTEGFGSIPISKRVLDVLGALEGKAASINGATQVRAGAVRPEIIVSYDKESAQKTEDFTQSLCIGAQIRIIRVPYFGKRGEVINLPHEKQKIETGALSRVLVARLESGEEVIVPRANVELC